MPVGASRDHATNIFSHDAQNIRSVILCSCDKKLLSQDPEKNHSDTNTNKYSPSGVPTRPIISHDHIRPTVPPQRIFPNLSVTSYLHQSHLYISSTFRGTEISIADILRVTLHLRPAALTSLFKSDQIPSTIRAFFFQNSVA